jgi:hypothetical protein
LLRGVPFACEDVRKIAPIPFDPLVPIDEKVRRSLTVAYESKRVVRSRPITPILNIEKPLKKRRPVRGLDVTCHPRVESLLAYEVEVGQDTRFTAD